MGTMHLPCKSHLQWLKISWPNVIGKVEEDDTLLLRFWILLGWLQMELSSWYGCWIWAYYQTDQGMTSEFLNLYTINEKYNRSKDSPGIPIVGSDSSFYYNSSRFSIFNWFAACNEKIVMEFKEDRDKYIDYLGWKFDIHSASSVKRRCGYGKETMDAAFCSLW